MLFWGPGGVSQTLRETMFLPSILGSYSGRFLWLLRNGFSLKPNHLKGYKTREWLLCNANSCYYLHLLLILPHSDAKFCENSSMGALQRTQFSIHISGTILKLSMPTLMYTIDYICQYRTFLGKDNILWFQLFIAHSLSLCDVHITHRYVVHVVQVYVLCNIPKKL